MNKKWLAYSTTDLENTSIVAKARDWFKSGVIKKEQLTNINTQYPSPFYTPSLIMKVMLFIFTCFALQAISGYLVLIMIKDNMTALHASYFLLGIGTFAYVELILIKEKFHYKSGTTEACIYSGLGFLSVGLFGLLPDITISYPILGFILTSIAAIRYLDKTLVLSSIFFFSWILFQLLFNMGDIALALMPFIFFICFTALYYYSQSSQKRYDNIIFEDLFIVVDVAVLLIVYLSVNYFVVRQLSVELMDLIIAKNEDIPFAWIFYILTVLIPLSYLYIGIKKKSPLFFRVALICLTLTVFTFKYYFSLGAPIVTITIAGGILLLIGLLCMNYLKEIRFGFTREKLLTSKWDNENLQAFMASQTLGGNIEVTNENEFGGGEFGGGGAGSNY